MSKADNDYFYVLNKRWSINDIMLFLYPLPLNYIVMLVHAFFNIACQANGTLPLPPSLDMTSCMGSP